MAKVTIPIDYVNPNDVLTFCVYSMCQAKCEVVLRTDAGETIFAAKKNSDDTNFKDSTDKRQFQLSQLKKSWKDIYLDISNNLNTPLQPQTMVSGVLKNDGNIAGYITNVCVEDQTDGDFQDIFITIGAFHKTN